MPHDAPGAIQPTPALHRHRTRHVATHDDSFHEYRQSHRRHTVVFFIDIGGLEGHASFICIRQYIAFRAFPQTALFQTYNRISRQSYRYV